MTVDNRFASPLWVLVSALFVVGCSGTIARTADSPDVPDASSPGPRNDPGADVEVNAGPDVSTTLPDARVRLEGVASGVRVEWTQHSAG